MVREYLLANGDDLAALLAVLDRRDHVPAQEREALVRLGWRVRNFSRGAEIVADRARLTESCLLLDGFAARCGYLRSGSRQFTAMHTPGDFVDLHAMLLKIIDHSVVAVTDCRVAFVDHAELQRLDHEHPHLSRLLAMLVAIDAAILRSWILGIGRRNPMSQLAHLICELYLRLVGRASELSFDFRIAQADLADMLGLSVVHTNRTVQELRARNAISWRNGVMRILDWNTLASLAEFDPLYLNLYNEPR